MAEYACTHILAFITFCDCKERLVCQVQTGSLFLFLYLSTLLLIRKKKLTPVIFLLVELIAHLQNHHIIL